jgi:Recombinase
MADFKERATAGLQYALLEVPEGPGRYKRIADIMNERGIKTLRGGKWTAENIRKRLKRGELSFGTGEVE